MSDSGAPSVLFLFSSISVLPHEARSSHLLLFLLLDREAAFAALFNRVAACAEEGSPSPVVALYDSDLSGSLPHYSVSPESRLELLHPFVAQLDRDPVVVHLPYCLLSPELCLGPGLSYQIAARPDSIPAGHLPRFLTFPEQYLEPGWSLPLVAQPDSDLVVHLPYY